MDKINTVLVAFSATSIHRKLMMRALDIAEQNNAKLIILSVRDKNIAEKVAKMTKNHGFLGERFVEKLKKDIIKDRNEVLSKRLNVLKKEAKDRDIIFEIMRLKGSFIEKIVDVAEECAVDIILVEDIGKKIDQLMENTSCDVVVVR